MPALPPKSTSWPPMLTMLWYARPVGVLPPRGVSSFTVNLQRRSKARLSTTVGDSDVHWRCHQVMDVQACRQTHRRVSSTTIWPW